MNSFSNFPALPGSLHDESRDWLISATDPFHDFEHPIEGAPDHVVSRSFTRKFVQSLTISAVADDDNIVITFTGFHGCSYNRFNYWGADYECDPATAPAGAVELLPIHILKRNGSNWPCVSTLIAGTSAYLGGFATAQVDDVPSRLVSLGVEVTDVTPALYRKGTIHANHLSGEVEHMNVGRLDSTAVTPLWSDLIFARKPTTAITATQLVATPGAFIGPAARGVYMVARLNEIQAPRRGEQKYPNGTTRGAQQPLVMLAEAFATSGECADSLFPQTSDNGITATRSELEAAKAWRDSGFMPFQIGISGVSVESVFQISCVTTVEYFPQVTHPFECGLATFSPVYDPAAFQLYHEIMRHMPAGVPVSMNAAGDYWRMLVGAARKAIVVVRRAAPYAGYALQGIGAATGDPVMTLAGRALASVKPAQSAQAKSKRK